MSATFERVIADIREREAKGIKTYGDTLRSETPVDHLRYAYEEYLDGAVYLRAEIDRRDEALAKVQALKNECERKLASHRLSEWPPPTALREADILLAEVLDLLKPLTGPQP